MVGTLPVKPILIVSCIVMAGCSLLFEQEAEVPMRDERAYRVEPFCATVQGYDEDAGKWVAVPYGCNK